jgi:hypothetical protein
MYETRGSNPINAGKLESVLFLANLAAGAPSANGYIASMATPLFALTPANSSAIVCKNIDFNNCDTVGVSPFSIDASGEGGGGFILFEDCEIPGMPRLYTCYDTQQVDGTNGGTSVNNKVLRTRNCRFRTSGMHAAYGNFLSNSQPDFLGLLPDYRKLLPIKSANVAAMIGGGLTNTADPTWGASLYNVLEAGADGMLMFRAGTPGPLAQNSFASWNQTINHTFTQSVGGSVMTTNHPEYFFPGLQVIDPADGMTYVVVGVNLCLGQVHLVAIRTSTGNWLSISSGAGGTAHNSVSMTAKYVAFS